MIKISNIAMGLSLTALTFGACTENFEELNTQPNAIVASNLDIGLLGQAFANAQGRAMYLAPGGGTSGFQIAQSLFGDLYSQYFATTQVNFDSDRHVQVGGWSNAAWNYFYGQAAPVIQFVEEFTEENELPLENAFIKVWKVQAYHRISDYWGPIIYSSFGNGETVVPYDSQEEVYRDFFTVLDEAVAVLKQNSGRSAFVGHDQMFGGSADKWLTYANSLRLRLAMRVKYVDPALSKAEAEKAVADGVMDSNDDSAFIQTTVQSRNPYWIITNWGEFRMSALMESVMVGYEDPRTGVYFSETVDYQNTGQGEPYQGLRNGLSREDLGQTGWNDAYSDMGVIFLNEGRGGSAAGEPWRVISAAEVQFLLAEGALEGWAMGGSAQEYYEKGIELSMSEPRIGADAAGIQAYINSSKTPAAVTFPNNPDWNLDPNSNVPVAFMTNGTKEQQLEQIGTQKWVAIYPDGWEAWAELRRLNYPTPYPRLNSDNEDVPRDVVMPRLIFVQGEFDNNNEAVTAAEQLPELTSRGGNSNGTKLWWDAKPE
ncbi:SusD/RagB family nutrient-binding outer membrane lipoprotein [Cyclobacterium jeungdonense]|uniref:SusD/RagB family nutrient-binding outer membrane lipoprotein n=1 Tax=Cyclobacterium jeungdonense TaxID=708087 RepID=A0ABT8C6P5_9BACT|nr:SusD/RagB family nutrient-binding outer membrane lipoprotein [Cyclobacterium jeungdonense]MDN3687787.1 SusD/RagB family nutrient-binding outer membrane lipoprotein [Cyclobacterium jeungdonense]